MVGQQPRSGGAKIQQVGDELRSLISEDNNHHANKVVKDKFCKHKNKGGGNKKVCVLHKNKGDDHIKACSCLFITLAIGVLVQGPLVNFDRSTAEILHTYASETLDLTDFIRVLSIPDSLVALALVGVLVAVALLVQRKWPTLAAWLVAVLSPPSSTH